MKARIPLDSKTKKLIREKTTEEINKHEYRLVNRVIKSVCYVLNRRFGFGKAKRLTRFLVEFFEVYNNRDELFWEHLDCVVIDELKLPFDREVLDLDGEPID